MAVITELIDAGLRLKQGGNLRGAIEHFKQLHTTYPGHARIMFELGTCWRAFGVPEQALPLYRELLALPKSQGLPPKDIPRLYTQLGATLLDMGEKGQALAIIEEGVRLHPSYRSLRAWRIFALSQAGSPQTALVDALELMLESLAPSRWDIFEADIKTKVKAMRADLPAPEPKEAKALVDDAPAQLPDAAQDPGEAIETTATAEDERSSSRNEIAVVSEAPEATETDVAVNLAASGKKRLSRRKKKPRAQMGKKAVRIDISGEADEPARKAGDDDADGGTLRIPIDRE